MANMSYCRFENTLSDFYDCHYNLDDINSESERRAAHSLYEAAKEYVERYEGNLEEEDIDFN